MQVNFFRYFCYVFVLYILNSYMMDFELLNVGYAQLGKGQWNWKQVVSPFIRIYVVTDGAAEIYFSDGSRMHCVPGRMYLIPPFTEHSTACQDHFSHYYLHFYEKTDSSLSVFDQFDIPYEVESEPMHTDACRNLCHNYPMACLKNYDPQSYERISIFNSSLKWFDNLFPCQKMEIIGVVYILLSCFMHKSKRRLWTQNPVLRDVMAYVYSHLSEPVSIKSLSQKFPISDRKFQKIIKQEFGTNFKHVILQKRIDCACRLLVDGSRQIKDIAYETGFSNASYFIRAFKKITGFTPAQYRSLG